jgi:putative transposase
MPRAKRLTLLDRTAAPLPLTRQAVLLGLSRASVYYVPVPVSAKEVAIKRRIDEVYTAHPFYGVPKITAVLRPEWGINHKRVEHYMREMGLAAIGPKPNLSKPQPSAWIFPYLLRGLAITRANQVWWLDITYVRLLHGWLYLVAVLDWFSRYVVSWELSPTLEVGFVLTALDRALQRVHPEIANCDQGSQFTSEAYVTTLKSAQVKISMDGRGRALDNVFTERLWRTVKYEEIFLHDYANPREARQGLSDYFPFYNEARPHQALANHTPAAVYGGKEVATAIQIRR